MNHTLLFSPTFQHMAALRAVAVAATVVASMAYGADEYQDTPCALSDLVGHNWTYISPPAFKVAPRARLPMLLASSPLSSSDASQHGQWGEQIDSPDLAHSRGAAGTTSTSASTSSKPAAHSASSSPLRRSASAQTSTRCPTPRPFSVRASFTVFP